MKTANQDLASQAESDRNELGIDASANVSKSAADSKETVDAAAEKALSENSEPTRRPADGELEKNHSVLGKSVTFKGDLHAEEDLFILGTIKGSIRHDANCLTIGVHGKVNANIVGRRIIVQGRVTGNVHATDSVVIEPSAHVRGDIYAPTVGLKEGARFKGSIDMDSDPVKVAEEGRSVAATRKPATSNPPVSAAEEERAEAGAAKPATRAESKTTTRSAKKRSARKTRETK